METILITGANRGIGLALTKVFLSANNHVVATCRNPESASDLQAVAPCKNLEILQLDVTDTHSISNLHSTLFDRPIDVLVNNAGILGGKHQSVEKMDYDAWLEAFKVNTIAPFRLTVGLKPNLLKSKRPRVVTLSSQLGSLSKASKDRYSYGSSKAAVNKVMQMLAIELHEEGIIVCPVHPGWVQTDMGGIDADITLLESAAGLFTLISSLTLEKTGRFFTWEGNEHPW